MSYYRSDEHFESMREKLASTLVGICPRWLQDRRDDIVQATMIRLMDVEKRGEGNIEFNSSYLWKVAYSAMVDEIRKLRRLQEIPLNDGMPESVVGLSAFHRVRGELEKSHAALDHADAAAQQSGDPLLEADVWIERGYISHSESLYGEVWTYFKKAEPVAYPSGPVDMQLKVLYGFAKVTHSLGRSRESFDYFRRIAVLLDADHNQWMSAPVLNNLALLGWQLNALGEMTNEEANALELKALDYAIKANNTRAGAFVRCLRAQDPLLTPVQAVEESRRALAITRQMGDLAGITYALRTLAQNQLRLNPEHPDAAFKTCDEAIEMARKSGDFRGVAWGWDKRMSQRILTGDRIHLIADSSKTFEAIEKIRDLQHDEMIQAGFISEWAEAYYRYSGYLLGQPTGDLSLDDVNFAFLAIERLRARILLDSLDASNATNEITPAGPLNEKRRAVLEMIARHQQQLLNGGLVAAETQKRLDDIDRLEV